MTTLIMARFFALLTLIADLFVVGSIVLVLMGRRSAAARGHIEATRSFFAEYGLVIAAGVAVTCTLGSLYLSEVANFIPCKLCWYQRIAMYPLALILCIAALKRDVRVSRYVIPIAAIGASLSVYHYLLERFPDLSSSASCDPAAPCTIVWIWQFHFISIPFMALSGFAAIATSLLWARPIKEGRKDEQRIARGATPQSSIQASEV